MLAVTTAEKTSTRWLSSLWNSLEGARVWTVNILDLWVIYLFVKVIVVNTGSTRVRKHFWEKSGCKSLSLKPSQIPRVTSQRGKTRLVWMLQISPTLSLFLWILLEQEWFWMSTNGRIGNSHGGTGPKGQGGQEAWIGSVWMLMQFFNLTQDTTMFFMELKRQLNPRYMPKKLQRERGVRQRPWTVCYVSSPPLAQKAFPSGPLCKPVGSI